MHDLRILSLNCWNGRAVPGAIARLCAERTVDAACLQELAPAQAAAVQAVLPHGKLEPAVNYQGLGIATRFPAEVQHLPLPRRNGRVATLRPEDWPQLPGAVELINVHIQAPHVRPWKSLPLRRAQVRALSDWLETHDAEHRVLVGDLNSTPVWPAYHALTAHLRDGALECAQANGRLPRRTWGPFQGSPRLLRIDHSLVHGARVTACEVVSVEGGDHSGLLVDVVIDD